MTRSTERERVRLLSVALDAPVPGTRVAIGDDAAVLGAPAGELVWSIDAAVEGVHFRRDLMTLEDAGYRATMAAFSDLAAMGSTPLGALAALTLPGSTEDEELLAIAAGQRAAALACGTAIVGGNLARGEVLTITTTVLGSAPRAILRSGARPGDPVALAGPVGLAGAGLVAALRGAPEEGPLAAAYAAFRRPRARIAEGARALGAGATAMIDVSDGLGTDAAQLVEASGVTVELDAESLVEPALFEAARALGIDALACALGGGEDYALVATFPPGVEPPSGFRPIGRCTARGPDAVVLVGADGTRRAAPTRGFDHFG